MNKVVVTATLLILGVFGTIFFFIQKNSNTTSNTDVFSPNNALLTPTPIFRPQTQQVQGATVAPQTQSQQQPTPTAYILATPTPVKQESATVEQISTAVIKTSKGDIEFSLFSVEALNTVNNFILKSKNGFYNNLTFHRVEDWVIQGGDPLGDGTGGGRMQTELNNRPFIEGSVGMARGTDIRVTNDSQFFITKTESSALNAQYTNFGLVTNGMEVVNKIEKGDKILEITFK